MKAEFSNNPNECYQLAEQKAAFYFKLLEKQVLQNTYGQILTKDFHSWKQNHIHRYPFLSFISPKKRKPYRQEYSQYIKWLEYTGKLDPYLDRSISYIYMRDLGKELDSPETQKKVRNTVENLKKQLTANETGNLNDFNMVDLYRWAQKEGIESAIIWLLEKLKTVSARIPKGMDPDHAQRKLIKIIAGVLMHAFDGMDDSVSPQERSRKLVQAVRLGYSYGLTYPFIDDLLDANVLSHHEKKQYSNLIRTALISGIVPELRGWSGQNKELIRYIHSELREAFDYIKDHQNPQTSINFFEQAYVFFHSQEMDRVKDLSNPNYRNEELFIPIILKSYSSRLIARSVICAPDDEGFDNRTFYYGIYNQLADDFADMFEDMKSGAVTPYTYYWKYHKQRPDLINPFELYWTVISNLIHNVYHSDPKTIEVILDRAINGLKRFKERLGATEYHEVMDLLASRNPNFNRTIQKIVNKAADVDFFDKLLRDHIISTFKNERKEREVFSKTIESVRDLINSQLSIKDASLLNGTIIKAANYSLEGDGKRLRPIITWEMAVNEYGLAESAIIPLLKSLEYMHTASLIFDDLPSQDNASIRRGRRTLHRVYNVAAAELTGLFLTQKAIEEQAALKQFKPETVLKLIKYSVRVTEDMCQGQAMDLESKGKPLTLEQLKLMSFYKTGIAFEASLIMPAILAQASETEIEALKKFARHAGIAFQIKDDLLDVEGNTKLLGKPTGKDAANNTSTFVSILGIEAARKEMWEQYCLAMEALQDLQLKTSFLKHLMNYIVNRDH